MTPSSEMKMAPVSLRIYRLAVVRGFDLGDVDLLHLQHRIHRPLGGGPIAAGGALEQDARGDLPREAPFVLAPAAVAFLAAVIDDRVPIAVGLLLAFGQDHEADCLIRLEQRSAVETDERLAEDSKLDGDLLPLRPRRRI